MTSQSVCQYCHGAGSLTATTLVCEGNSQMELFCGGWLREAQVDGLSVALGIDASLVLSKLAVLCL